MSFGKRAHIAEPNVPDQTNDHVWTIRDDIMEPLWTEVEILQLHLESIWEVVVDEESDEVDREFYEHEHEVIDFEDEDSVMHRHIQSEKISVLFWDRFRISLPY